MINKPVSRAPCEKVSQKLFSKNSKIIKLMFIQSEHKGRMKEVRKRHTYRKREKPKNTLTSAFVIQSILLLGGLPVVPTKV
jgi:hypothetical protein